MSGLLQHLVSMSGANATNIYASGCGLPAPCMGHVTGFVTTLHSTCVALGMPRLVSSSKLLLFVLSTWQS